MRKQKIWIAIMLIALALFMSIPASAAEETQAPVIQNAYLNDWTDGTPDGWRFDSPDGSIEQIEQLDGNVCARITLLEPSYGFLVQEITLKPQTTYHISCMVQTEDLVGDSIGANLNLESQIAQEGVFENTDGEWYVIDLFVRTNVDENQIIYCAWDWATSMGRYPVLF